LRWPQGRFVIKIWELFQLARQYKAGEKLTGKVTGIQPYGAFVSLDDQTQGLVHISEITYGFVKDINEFLSIGDEVEVKVLEVIEKDDKISLSIRALLEKPERRDERPRETLQERIKKHDAEGFNSLEEKLEDWIEKFGQSGK